ncbi:hypothetical protein LJB93_02800 [Desulfovibrio sp. OttesenSCG-928-F07]|nr:hypothetical protein [Desulfovibrio sp. OttesenSCG-928-F07]
MKQLTKSTLFILFISCLLSSPAFAASTGSAVFRLSMAGNYPDSHPVVQNAILPWLNEIEVQSKGKVVVTYYGPDILIPQTAHFEAVRKAYVNMAHQHYGQSQAKLLFTSTMAIPSDFKNSLGASSAAWRLYKNLPELQKEYEGIKLLTLHSSPPLTLFTNFKITQFSDLQHKKILCDTSDTALILRALGATPLLEPMQSWVHNFSTLSADGAVLSFDMLNSYNLMRLPLSYYLDLNVNVTPAWIGISKQDFEALPRDLRYIIENTSGEKLSLKIAQVLDSTCVSTKKTVTSANIEAIKLPVQSEQKCIEELKNIAQNAWIVHSKEARIENGEKILERIRRIYKSS